MGDGSSPRCLEAGRDSAGELGSPEPQNSYAAGFQRCILDFTGMNSVWAANRGSDGDPRRDMGFQTKPKRRGRYLIKGALFIFLFFNFIFYKNIFLF